MNELNDRSVPFCQILRQRRTALRLRQTEIAAELRVSDEIISHWENGRRRMELDKIPRLAAILQLDATDLCRRALSEWHPRFHDALFGVDQAQTAPCLGAPQENAGSSRDLLPPGAAGGHPLESGVIVANGLSQAEELAQ